MSVTIRLSRIGRKNQPAYKLVVSNTRDKRNGKFVDILGYFNPSEPSQPFHYDKEKYEKWAKRGALVTDAVKKLIEGKYEYVKYEPRKAVKKEGEDTPKEDKPEGSRESAKEVVEEKVEETEDNKPEASGESKEEETQKEETA